MRKQRKQENHTEREKLPLNRGVELILRKKDQPQPKHNVLLLKFGKLISLFKREITVYFEFSIDIRKPQ